MIRKSFEIPERVRFKIRHAGQESWLRTLPECVEYLAAKWAFTPQQVLAGGSESFVMSVTLESGTQAAVKIGVPSVCDCAHEANVLRLGAGTSYVTLLNHDDAANALLMERLGIPMRASGKPVSAQLDALCETIRQGWIPLDADHGLMTGAAKADWLADFMDTTWRNLTPRLSGQVLERAIEYAARRRDAFTVDGSCLVHGDAHPDNALAVPHSPNALKLVDPDGSFAEPACDLAVPMRDWSEELLAADALALGLARCARIAELTGVDAEAIWQWGFMERVSTGLLMLQIGITQEGQDMLAVAEAWCGGAP